MFLYKISELMRLGAELGLDSMLVQTYNSKLLPRFNGGWTPLLPLSMGTPVSYTTREAGNSVV